MLAARPALADLFIVGRGPLVTWRPRPSSCKVAERAEKCPRCWNIRTDVGRDAVHPDVCGRCAAVLER